MKKWRKYLLTYIWGFLLVIQIILFFVFGLVNEVRIDIITYAGWVIWVISVIFGWLPIFYLKRKGGVAKGKSYVKTTLLVDTGLYSILRHPQYTAGILFSLALALISQHWVIIALGLFVTVLLYIDILKADKHEIEKYGEDYIDYMKKVPRTNFILGIYRLLRRRMGADK